jgi:hypothetical protein
MERNVKEFSTQTTPSNSGRSNFTFKDIGEAIEELVNQSFVHKYTQKIKYNKVSHEQVENILKNTVSCNKRKKNA